MQYADLYTPEGESLADQPWNAYPRPQLRRDSFLNLNGEWDFSAGETARFDRKIRVPFPVESLLSGIHEHFPAGCPLWYRRQFSLPEGFRKARVLLHLGACDQTAEVFLNGIPVGTHSGGYHPMTFDITDAHTDVNTLVIRATDDLRSAVLPYGKQKIKRGGMWYTPVSGIWQTVWLESVPAEYIHALDLKTGENWAEIDVGGGLDGIVTVQTPDGSMTAPLEHGRAKIVLQNPRLWCPEDPFLYEFAVQTAQDRVESYFALRTLETKIIHGIPRLCLNGKPYFFHGLLDQGYWSDGIYTPADPSCFEKDILAAKKLGFNTLRKHIKIEPEQFYYDCDRLGMVVFQDMVNNGRYSFFRDTALPTLGVKRRNDCRLHRDPATREAFLRDMEATVRQLKNHPASATGRSSTRAGGSSTVTASADGSARWTLPASSTPPPAGSVERTPMWTAATSISGSCA